MGQNQHLKVNPEHSKSPVEIPECEHRALEKRDAA